MSVVAARLPRRATIEVDWAAAAAGTVLLLAVIAALAPQWLTSVDPQQADPLASLRAPGGAHPLGTDIQGRDVLARIVYGARWSVPIGLGATALGLALGVLLGVLGGLGPRWLDRVVARTTDVVASFPEVLLALLLITFTGRGVANLVLALGIAGMPKYTRLIRSQVAVTSQAGYVEQAVTFGLGRWRTAARHVLPNALGALPVVATLGFGGAIIGSSGLSFLGLGPMAPAAEWGLTLSESRNYLRQAWWTGVFPGVALTVVVIAATVLGRRLQRRYERRNR